MTITALRDQLEESHASRGKAVRQAHAADEDELRQLKATVATLRDQLEAARMDKDRKSRVDRV